MAEPESINCMNLTAAAKRVFDFKVEAYSTRKMALAGLGESYQSGTFSVGGHDWAVRFSPMLGVSLHLVLLNKASAGESVGVKFAATMLDKSGKPSPAGRHDSWEFSYQGQEEGFFGLTLMDEKDHAEFIQGDCLVVRCTVSVLRRQEMRQD